MNLLRAAMRKGRAVLGAVLVEAGLAMMNTGVVLVNVGIRLMPERAK